MCGQQTSESGGEAESMGLRAYARSRGRSLGAVQRAIKSQRLRTSVIRDAKGLPRILPALADREWASSTLHDREPVAAQRKREQRGRPAKVTSASAYQEAQTALIRLREQRERLEFEQFAGKLVYAADVERLYVDLVTNARNMLLAVPAKVKSQHPEAPRQFLGTVDAEIRRALELLAHRGGTSA